MDASEASTFNTVVDWYKGRGHWFSPPMVQYVDGVPTVLSTPPDEWSALPSSLSAATSRTGDNSWSVPFGSISDIYNVEARSTSPLAEYYTKHIRQTLQKLVQSGKRFGALVMGHTPDIAIYAKILTAGLLPMSATLASKSIFASFLSDNKVDALLHGHSYTANPVGCAVALKGIEMMEGKEWKEEKELWNGAERWSFWSEEFIKSVSGREGVKGSMAMGTVLAIELESGDAGGESYKFHLRLS
jgi:hypothetical protein